MTEDVLNEIKLSIVNGDSSNIQKLLEKALEKKNAEDVIRKACIPAMNVVGEKFSRKEFYIADMLMSAVVMQVALDKLEPLITKSMREARICVVLGTVRGDTHDIGKNLAKMTFKGAGFKVIDLGVDIPTECFIEAIKENKAKILGLSSLLTTTMPVINEVIIALRENHIRNKVIVIVGGAPITEQFAKEVGADAYAPDSFSGVKEARRLLEITEGTKGSDCIG